VEINEIISSGLLELYVTGSASQEERLQVEAWAEQYPEVKQELEEMEEAMEQYAISQAVEPGTDLKEKIMARIAIPAAVTLSDSPHKEPAVIYAIPPLYKWAVAASIILLLGSILLNYTFYNKYKIASKDLQVAQQEMKKQQQLAQEMKGENELMRDRHAVPVVMKGPGEALAKIFWMQNTGDVYVDPSNLPEAPSGMQYQLWAIVDGKPVDAGMITTEKGVYHIQKMKSFGKAQAFAITLETAGGHPAPQGEMIVQAKI
jgi:anti-sigma-K factor RskA